MPTRSRLDPCLRRIAIELAHRGQPADQPRHHQNVVHDPGKLLERHQRAGLRLYRTMSLWPTPERVLGVHIAHAKKGKVKTAYDHTFYLKERAELMQKWASLLDSLRGN